MKKWFFKLLAITALSLLLVSLRLYKLGSFPDSLIVDEAHYAYLAYSILETGKDEHGLSYPLVFRGFGDYKLPVQVYSLVPLVSLFGLNNFTARLPSALAGLLLLPVIYFLFREWRFSKQASFLAVLITFIAPWMWILSRFAFEANLGLLFFAAATLFAFKALRIFTWTHVLLSAVLFVLAAYSYVTYKFLSIVFVLFFCVTFLKKQRQNLAKILLFASLFLLLLSPFFIGQGSTSNLARFKQVGILSDTQLIAAIDENRHFCLQSYPKIFCYSLFNKPMSLLSVLSSRFLSLYSPDYLFIDGDEPKYINVEQSGLFNLFLLPFYLLGLLLFMRQVIAKDSDKKLFNLFIGLGLLLSPLPGILSGVQKIRISTTFLFILPLFILAYEFLQTKLASKGQKLIFNLILIGLIVASFFAYYLRLTGVHALKNDFFYDSFAPKIFEASEKHLSENAVDEVVIQDFFSDPIMYYAYYQKIDPAIYQREVILGELEGSGFQHAVGLGKYRVAQNEEPQSLACAAHFEGRKVIYIDNNWSKSKSFILEEIKSRSGALNYAFVIDLTAYGESLAKEGKCD